LTKKRATANPAQGWIKWEGKRTASITTLGSGWLGGWNTERPVSAFSFGFLLQCSHGKPCSDWIR